MPSVRRGLGVRFLLANRLDLGVSSSTSFVLSGWRGGVEGRKFGAGEVPGMLAGMTECAVLLGWGAANGFFSSSQNGSGLRGSSKTSNLRFRVEGKRTFAA